ncbi:BRO family protein [Paenibacillus macerans]|uniref:BRO-N domain-containing protein n=1 Tax=Paenibacillus macerans TaxID=44252 RepID=UPI0020401CB8|nr:BRO family protein [Paenibacillus macerans]MCM3701411.1 hypothetical protein [Paenibacillus macerans]
MNLRLVKQGEFLGIKCDFWMDKQGEVYMTRKQIGEALQYTNPQKAVDKLHERRKKRLSKFSVTVKLTGADGKDYATNVYSARGVYELIRFSGQPIADDFYDWVYEIIEAIRTGRISEQVMRQAGLTVRHTLTDSIRDNVEESPNKHRYYQHYTELAYKTALGMNSKELRLMLGLKKGEKIRDHLTAEELEAVLKAERHISNLLQMHLSYHDIKAIFTKNQVVRALPRRRDRIAAEKAK